MLEILFLHKLRAQLLVCTERGFYIYHAYLFFSYKILTVDLYYIAERKISTVIFERIYTGFTPHREVAK